MIWIFLVSFIGSLVLPSFLPSTIKLSLNRYFINQSHRRIQNPVKCIWSWHYNTIEHFQKQPPEVFRKKSYSQKFRNIHKKTPVFESLFNKVTGFQVSNIITKRLQHRNFPVNIAKFLRTTILKNICEQLLLHFAKIVFQRFSLIVMIKKQNPIHFNPVLHIV